MIAKVIWTERALSDLDIIYEFLSINSTKVSEQIIYDILNRIAQLECNPLSVQVELQLKLNYTYRYIVEGNYKIIYRFENNIVFINTVFDTRQNPKKLIIK